MITIGPFYFSISRNCGAIGSYGARNWLPWSIGAALRRADGVFDPSLAIHIGSADEPCGFSATLLCARRKSHGRRLMRATVGGDNPQPLRWQ